MVQLQVRALPRTMVRTLNLFTTAVAGFSTFLRIFYSHTKENSEVRRMRLGGLGFCMMEQWQGGLLRSHGSAASSVVRSSGGARG